jgi:hypothetical protein
MPVATVNKFGTCAVIGKEHNQRVFIFPVIFEPLNEPPDFLIHPIDHRRVHRHFLRLKNLLFGR